MSLAWPLILFALLAPLATQILRASAGAVIFAGALALGALALANAWALSQVVAPELPPGTDPLFDMEFRGITGYLLWVFFALTAVIAAAQAIKDRLGVPDRQLTLTGFWLYFGGLILALALPLSGGQLGGVLAGAPADLAGTVAVAGVIILVWVILLRPLLRALRRQPGGER